ncbi:acetate--CoA ligase family protein [Arvimicrobium flavum]|uniref:acetate--CoA ligase family protein n=1 Tax=Arvimicrobium flavum TaxID=3393320 RepID=UPI00237AB87C|nr:acetate--CoA ligase family protein [Mesorhizobium shangrilense]
MSMDRQKVAEYVVQAARAGRPLLREAEAKSVLESFGLRVPRGVTLAFDEDPAAAVGTLRPPFVVKVMSERIVHKTEHGGVALNLQDLEAVRAAIADMKSRLGSLMAPSDGWLVEESIPRGTEIVVGGAIDPRFGPTVMFGLGGILVELMADVAFRICPITRADARDMIAELKGRKLLDGWRGSQAVDLETIEETLLAIGGEGGLLLALEEAVSELDINPMIATADGVVAVDARIILKGDVH